MDGLFIHVPKTAGTSIKKSLNKNYGGHYKASFLINKFNCEECFTFSFVRNPWDRFVSAYFYLTSGRGNRLDTEFGKYILSLGSFKEFILLSNSDFKPDFQNLKRLKDWVHFLPQVYWIDQKLDFIGKFESIEKDYNYICDRLNIDSRPLIKTNSSFHLDYRNYYDDQTREIIRNLYKKDIELYNYCFNEN